MDDFEKYTGWKTKAELDAYEKGRMDEEKVIVAWIKKWKGEVNSEMGNILHNKFNELKKK